MNVIEIVLKIKSPVTETDGLDLTEKTDEVLEAINVFNEKFRDWSKRLILTRVTVKALHLLLVIEKTTLAENISVRETRYFIQYLRNKKGWSEYTTETNKMFKTIEFNRLDTNLTVAFRNKVMSNEMLYKAQKEDIDFLGEVETLNILSESQGIDMSDDEALAIFSYLLKTSNNGPNASRKSEDSKKIKKILFEWI